MSSGVASCYAKALLVATKQKSTHMQAMEQLKIISEALNKDEQLKGYFSNPIIPANQKNLAIKAAITGKGFLDEVVSCVLLMTERGRLTALPEMVESFQDGLDRESGTTRGKVMAAKPLTPEAKTELEKKITQVLKKKVVLTFKEEANLLGGVVAQVGGWTFDDSIETHLKRMTDELNRRAY